MWDFAAWNSSAPTSRRPEEMMLSIPQPVEISKPDRAPSRGPRLREATFNDYEQIAKLEASHGLESKTPADWSHLWLENPAYRPGWPIGWVVEDARGIVASVGNIPLSYELEGRPVSAASGRAQVAESPYRSATTLLLSRIINQPNVDLYLNNTVMPAAAAPFSVFECPRVPAGLWDQSAFWIVDHAAFFRSLLRRKQKFSRLGWLTPSAMRDSAYERRLPQNGEITRCTAFDERFDRFWAELRSRHSHRLLAVRSGQILRWHFGPALRRNALWIAAVGDARGFNAYAIFDRKDNAALGLKQMRLVDFVSLDGTTALLARLIRWAIGECRKSGVHVIESVGRWMEKGEFLDRTAPHRRKLATWTYFYRANQPELAEKLKEPRCWTPSLLDGSASL
jgi:hypothetical protein